MLSAVPACITCACREPIKMPQMKKGCKEPPTLWALSPRCQALLQCCCALVASQILAILHSFLYSSCYCFALDSHLSGSPALTFCPRSPDVGVSGRRTQLLDELTGTSFLLPLLLGDRVGLGLQAKLFFEERDVICYPEFSPAHPKAAGSLRSIPFPQKPVWPLVPTGHLPCCPRGI